MSLLLDALKKAAEQKAAKAREKEAEAPRGDETALEPPADDTGVTMADDDVSLPRHQLEDETQFNQTEIQTRIEPDEAPPPEDGTETRLEVPDDTETGVRARSEQMQTGEDETIVFTEDDITEFMDLSPGDVTSQLSEDDATELTQLTRNDDTGLGGAAPDGSGVQHEDTDMRFSAQPDDTSITAGTPPAGDETDISIPPTRAEDVTRGEPETRSVTADDTSFTRPAGPSGEDTDLSRTEVSAADETDVSLSRTVSDITGTQVDAPSAAEDDATAVDDDMSLLLVEHEQTSFTSPTSVTDPQRPEDQFSALRGEDSAGDDMSIADTTRQQAEEATSPRGSTTVTAGIAGQTRSSQVPPPRPPDTTATYTYAPDNYDRTLMRLPNDDASRLFAGMKSDSDVVMTPDYAKRVFRSKSSAQRVQNFKIYGGIAIALLLAVGVYGVLEYQSEVERIDTSLRPLKRDPMPGVIRPRDAQEDSTLFSDGAIDERTVELIQNADDLEPVSDSGVVAESEPQPAAEAQTDEAPPAAETTGSGVEIAQNVPSSGDLSQPVGGSGVIAMNVSPQTGADGAESSNPNLQIKPGNRVQRQQVLLREAYEAYKAGDDALALERYNQVLALDPGNRSALLGRAAINVQNDNSSAAIEDYRRLLLANPKDSLAMASLLAVANFSPRETETQLKLMIRDEPESPYLNFALANAYGAQNRWQEAQGHYFTALEHNPGDPNYAYNLAVSLEHISQPKAAISYYRRALENYNNGLATFNREVVDRRLEILERK